MMRRKKNDRTPWAELSESLKQKITEADWERVGAERRAAEEARRKAMERPADWVEPTITVEQIEREPFGLEFATKARELGLTVLTRSQYLDLRYGNPDPRPWTVELENDLPDCLREPYREM